MDEKTALLYKYGAAKLLAGSEDDLQCYASGIVAGLRMANDISGGAILANSGVELAPQALIKAVKEHLMAFEALAPSTDLRKDIAEVYLKAARDAKA